MAISVNKWVSELISGGGEEEGGEGGQGRGRRGIGNSGLKDCAIITTDRVEGFGLGFWNDISCNFVYGYICEQTGK